MIDEVHLLGCVHRGHTLEAVITRMKTIDSMSARGGGRRSGGGPRFVAVSATIPNVVDIAEWLSQPNSSSSISQLHIKQVKSSSISKVLPTFSFYSMKN